MVIRVLSFEGCPSCEATMALVESTARELRLQAEIEAVQVRSQEDAERYHFLGSPTIQIDGRDIETERRLDEPSIACRVYRTSKGLIRVPPKTMLVEALRRAQSEAG